MAFLQHTVGIMLRPDIEWKAIRGGKHSFKQVFLNHVPFLALIPCISFFIGVTKVGWAFGSGDPVKLTVQSAAQLCILTYFALLAGVFFFGEFINWMSRTFGVKDSAEKRRYNGTALAVHVTTPIFLMGASGLYPSLWLNVCVLGIAGTYAVYLIYDGLPILMNISEDQAFMFASSIVIVGFVLMMITLVCSTILWNIGLGPVYID
jgi:hypothetical protein